MLSRRENDDLAALAAATRAGDPAFADHLGSGWPVAPCEYRRARRLAAGLFAMTAALLAAAMCFCDWPVVAAVFLLAALGCGMSVMFVWPPADMDGWHLRPQTRRHD